MLPVNFLVTIIRTKLFTFNTVCLHINKLFKNLTGTSKYQQNWPLYLRQQRILIHRNQTGLRKLF